MRPREAASTTDRPPRHRRRRAVTLPERVGPPAGGPARGWAWIRSRSKARSGTGRAERRRDLLDGLRLGGADVLAALPVRGRDLVRQGEDEAPVVVDLPGGRL